MTPEEKIAVVAALGEIAAGVNADSYQRVSAVIQDCVRKLSTHRQ